MERPDTWIVKPEDERPERPDGTCFYCGAPIGGRHRPECHIPKKSVIMDFTVRLPVLVPDSPEWDADTIESYYNANFWGYYELLSVLKHFVDKNEECILNPTENGDEDEYQFNEVSAKLISVANIHEDAMAVNAP